MRKLSAIPYVLVLLFIQAIAAHAQVYKLDGKGKKNIRNELINDYEGTILSIKNNRAILQGNEQYANTVYEIKLHRFSDLEKKNLKELSENKGNKVHFLNMTLDDAKPISDRSSSSVKSDCTETKISASEILNLAKNASNPNDFFNSIPKSSLQKFTMAYESGSPQGASIECPRVVRFSADGRVIIAYRGCGGNPPRTVEMINFDDQTKSFKFSSMTFDNGQTKVVENDAKCLQCHLSNNRTMPGPNWQQYEHWDGFYGSGDDFLNSKEKEDLLHLKENQKDNPAYSTLPWAKDDPLYPYVQTSKPRNYHYRPNAHLTVALSHLKSQQIARKMLTSEKGERFKYLTLLNALKCVESARTLRKLKREIYGATGKLIDLKKKEELDAFAKGEIQTGKSNVFQISRALGLAPEDWNLGNKDAVRLHRSDPNYNTAEYELHAYVKGALLINVIDQEAPELRSELKFLNFFTKFAGDEFACLEEGTGVENLSDSSRDKVCKFLEKKQHQLEKSLRDQDGRTSPLSIFKRILTPEETLQVCRIEIDHNSKPQKHHLEAPAEINACISCHSNSVSLPIPFHDPQKLKEKLKEKATINTQKTYGEDIIERIMDGSMPYDGELSTAEKGKLVEYIKSLLN